MKRMHIAMKGTKGRRSYTEKKMKQDSTIHLKQTAAPSLSITDSALSGTVKLRICYCKLI
jgi:hypothetical protein